ncbi:MAG: hypothetical protein ACTSUB_06515 [Candidatus Thorarchaeota archaeon]
MMGRDYEGGTYSQEDSLIVTIGKFFVHGAAFTILFELLFGFVDVFLSLLMYISILGIVVFFVVYFIIVGTVNHGIAGYLWKVESRSNIPSLIGQGLVMGIIIAIFQVPVLFIDLMLWYAPFSVYFIFLIVQFIVISFVSGLVGKQVATWFSKSKGTPSQQPWSTPSERGQVSWESPAPQTSRPGIPTYCPSCRAAFPIKQSDLDERGVGRCRMCGFEIAIHGQDSFSSQRTPSSSQCPYCRAELPPREMSDQTGGVVTCTSCGASFKDNRPRTRGSQQPRRSTRDWDW